MTKLYMQHLRSLFWFLLNIRSILSLNAFPFIIVVSQISTAPPSYERLTSKCSFCYNPAHYSTVTLYSTFWLCFVPLAYLYWKWLVITTSKPIIHFTKKKCMFYLAPFQSTYTDTLNSHYIARGGTTMNYAKKVVIFIIMHVFW